MAKASVFYPQNPEYYYYKISPGGTRKYFSIDGKLIPKKEIESIEKNILNYDPHIAIFFFQKELNALTTTEIPELEKKKKRIEKIIKHCSPNINIVNYQKDDPQHYYTQDGNIYDYRKYISEDTNLFLKKMGESAIYKNGQCTQICIDIYKIKKFDLQQGENYSKMNVSRLYEPRLTAIETELCALEKKRKELHLILQKLPHIAVKDVEKLMASFHWEMNRLNASSNDASFGKKSPPPSFKKTGDVLLDLGITDRSSFKIWVKKNHPDRHQSSRNLEEITKQFMRVTEAARKKGYLGNGGKP